MKKIHIICMILIVFAACTKISDEKKKKQDGTYEVAIEGYINQQFKIQGNCTNVFAAYADFSNQGLENTKSLTIEGRDDQNRLIGIVLYFNKLPLDGIFHLGIDDQTITYGGMGQFIPNVLDAQSLFYTTDDNHFGTCMITEYNQPNQTISGTFDFTGQATDFGGANFSGMTARFSGSFNNIPINDLTDGNNPKGVCFGTQGTPLGTGGNNGTGQTSTITFTNPVYTPIEITFNGQTKTAPVGGNAVFSGSANTSGTGTASTSGKSSSGTQVGLLLTWNNFTMTFPAAGTNLNSPLNVGSEFFFLKMKNTSSYSLQKVYVNYGLQSQTVDNVSIPNDGAIYNLGYYKAYTNSNIRAESGNNYWSFNSLNLSFTNNQSTILSAN